MKILLPLLLALISGCKSPISSSPLRFDRSECLSESHSNVYKRKQIETILSSNDQLTPDQLADCLSHALSLHGRTTGVWLFGEPNWRNGINNFICSYYNENRQFKAWKSLNVWYRSDGHNHLISVLTWNSYWRYQKNQYKVIQINKIPELVSEIATWYEYRYNEFASAIPETKTSE